MNLKNIIKSYKKTLPFLKISSLITVIIVWIKQTYSPLFSPMMVNEADAYSRLWHIIFLPISNVWLPGFQYVMRFFSIIKDNGTFFNYRLGIYIYAILLALVIFLIIKNITKSFLLSLLGLIFFLFHPLTQQLSVITLTEIPWLFFLFLSIYFLFFTKYKNKLILGLFAFAISQSIRYESWFLLSLLIPYLFILSKKENRNFVKPILIAIIFPILWMLILGFYFGNPLSFIIEKFRCSHGEGVIAIWSVGSLKSFFDLQLDTVIFPHFLVSIFLISGLFFKKIKTLPISLFSIYLFLCFFLETLITFNENTSPRFFYYLVPVLSILIPVCIHSIFHQYPNILKPVIYISCFLVFFSIELKLDQNYYFNINLSEIKDIEESIQKLKDNSNIYICVDETDYLFSNILEYSLEYKNLNLDCYKDFYQQDESSGMVISIQNEKKFDSKINYLNKIKLSDHIIYLF